MSRSRTVKVAAASLLAAAVVAGGIALTTTGGSKGPDSVQRHWAAANDNVAPVSNGSGATDTKAAPTPTASTSVAVVPDSNSNVVSDDSAKAAIAEFGQDQIDKAVQHADMFVAIAHADCGRLSGTSDPKGIAALTLLYTPESLSEVQANPSRALLMTDGLGLTFPDKGCAQLSRTTWAVQVQGTDDPVVWLTGTAKTILKPAQGPFTVTQTFRLGLVPTPDGWRVKSSDISKPETAAIKG